MAACDESTCWRRYYRFVLDNDGEVSVDWAKTKFDIKDKDGYEYSQTWDQAGTDRQKKARVAVKAALKGLKERGEEKRKCPDTCRCPESVPPPDDDGLWSKTADSQRKRTKFTGSDQDQITFHFVVKEFTADVIQPCKELEDEVIWLPMEVDLLALNPDVLTAEIRGAQG